MAGGGFFGDPSAGDQVLARALIVGPGLTAPAISSFAGKAVGVSADGTQFIALPADAFVLTATMQQLRDDTLTAKALTLGYRDTASAAALTATDKASVAALAQAGASASAAAALLSSNSATLAAATVNTFANAAATNVPRGLTQASVGAITAGSGGANGTFALGWTGGNFTIQPTGFFIVTGGVVTSVTITGPGLYIGAAPTPPTPVFTASAGLTGAAVALTAQFLIASGVGYWALSSDGTRLDRYVNNAGAALVVAGLFIPLNGGAALTLANTIIQGRGRRNLFRDPFQRDKRLPTSQAAMLETDDTFYNAGAAWTSAAAVSPNPYSDTFAVKNVGGAYKNLTISLARLGLVPGDAFALAFDIASTGSVSILGQYRGHSADYIGASISIAAAVASSTAGKVIKTPDMTVPALAFSLDLSILSTADFEIRARWGHLGTAATLPDGPVDELAIPRGLDRMASAEAQSMGANGLTLKTTAYSARTVAVAGTPTAPAFNAYNGYGVIIDTASVPSGFNALEISGGLVWEAGFNPPTTIYAILRVGVGSEVPLIDGRLIGIGSITVDPTSGSIPQQSILYRDPLTGDVLDPATILAQCGDHIGIGLYGINASGMPCERLYTGGGTTAYASAGSTYNGQWRTTGFGDIEVWSQSAGVPGYALSLVNLTNAREVYKTPSDSFAAAIAARVDEAPALVACPPKAWAIVGKETFLYWATMLQRDWRRTNFNAVYSAAIPTNSGPRAEGWLLTPTAPGTTTLTVNASRGDILSDTKVVTLVACAASAAAGTYRLLMMGDSLVEGNAGQTTITALSAADGVTTVVNVGTKGAGVNKMEGYSGQPLTAFLAAQIFSGAGLIANPFYNPGTSAFSFAYYVANSLGGTPPTHVLLEGGFWEVSHAATDSQAATGVATRAAAAETIIASIAAYNAANGTSIKTALWTQPIQASDGQDGQDPGSIGSSAGQLRRSMIKLSEGAINQFSGREGSKVYVIPAGTCMDPETAYPRAAYAPKNAAVAARYNGTPYATYAAMIADLGPPDETVTYATDVARWFVKEGPTTKGRWRGAVESDGFARRITDGIHVSTGWRQLAQQIFAWIKNNP